MQTLDGDIQIVVMSKNPLLGEFVEYLIDALVMPVVNNKGFFGEPKQKHKDKSWISKSEKSKKLSKKMPAKKVKSSSNLKKPTKKETKSVPALRK